MLGGLAVESPRGRFFGEFDGGPPGAEPGELAVGSRHANEGSRFEQFGAPLAVRRSISRTPRREVLVRLVACGVCHTDITASGADPSGYAPAVLGHEGAGVVRRSAKRSDVEVGDHVVTLFRPSAARCVLPEPADQPLHGDPRAQNKGFLPDGTARSRAAASRSATSWARARSRSTR